MVKKISKWNNEYETDFFCPNCGSNEVVLKLSRSYYHTSNCKKCHYGLNSGRVIFNN